MKVIHLLVSLTMAAALCLPAMAQKKPKPGGTGSIMYKCLDDRGKIYYSDKLTQECAQVQEMNSQGRVVKKHGSPAPEVVAKPTPDEVAAHKDTADRRRRDRALISTYTSEEEIDVARDHSLAIPLQAVKTAESRFTRANAQLFDLKSQANRLAEQQKAIPPQLLEEINAKQKEVAVLEAELQQKKNFADSIRAKYEADKQRYRELKVAGK
ncbi:MAG: hypothetical protein ACT4PQ_09860 [Betaproteobacteria bacterium]